MYNISIGGVNFLIKSKNSEFISKIMNKYKEFVSCDKYSYILNIKTRNSLVYDGDLDIKINNDIFIYRKDIKAIIKSNYIDLEIFDDLGCFNSFLLIFYSLILINRRSLLIHSVGFSNGYIFAGSSDSGKTTLAKNSRYKVINDEILILSKLQNKFYLCGTPFSTNLDFIKNISVEVKNIFFLEGKDLIYEPLSPLFSLKYLLSNVIFFSKDVSLNKKLFLICSDICKSIPCYKIGLLRAQQII